MVKLTDFLLNNSKKKLIFLAHLLLDQSKSMDYSSIEISKLEYSKILAHSLAYLMLKQQDAVGITLFDSKFVTIYLQDLNQVILMHYSQN